MLNSMNMIAMTIVYELGLNKPTAKDSSFVLLNYDKAGYPSPSGVPPRTMEERRLTLTCFYLTST